MNLSEFTVSMLVYCFLTRASETSGFRTRARNETVGGVEHSAHTWGLARDVVYDAPLPVEQRVEVAARCGLRLIPEDDHDHLQPLDWKAG